MTSPFPTRYFSVTTLVFAIGGLGPGCRQVVGIDDREVFEAAADVVSSVCGIPVRGSDCAKCMAKDCCIEAERCSNDIDCQADQECLQNCASGDSACQYWCDANRTNPTFLNLEHCRQDPCAEHCGPWDCLEHVNWQVLSPSLIRVSARVLDGLNGPSVDGVQVRVCWFSDPVCSEELSRAETHDSGVVELTFNPAVDGKRGPAPVFLEFTKEGWPPHLLMLNTPPLSFNFDVGDVSLDSAERVEERGQAIAKQHQTSLDPDLAMVKLRVMDCNLRPTEKEDVVLSVSDAESVDEDDWSLVAVNVPVPKNLTLHVVARRDDPSEPAIIAAPYLVVRPGTVTLAPFIAPTP